MHGLCVNYVDACVHVMCPMSICAWVHASVQAYAGVCNALLLCGPNKIHKSRKCCTYLTKSIVQILRWFISIGEVYSPVLSKQRSMKFLKCYPILQSLSIIRLSNWCESLWCKQALILQWTYKKYPKQGCKTKMSLLQYATEERSV